MSTQLQFMIAVSVWTWLRHLGGFGLILLGVADSSVVPLPGSMDVLTIYLAARHHQLWWYYAFMAMVGAVLGGYITYMLARKGGKEAFERKLSSKKAAKIFERFERWGFGAVALPALLPPPFPIVPFLLAAGALQYSRKKFIAALALGRAVEIHDRRRAGSDLWKAHRPVLFAVLQASSVHTDWTCGGGRGYGSYPILSV